MNNGYYIVKTPNDSSVVLVYVYDHVDFTETMMAYGLWGF